MTQQQIGAIQNSSSESPSMPSEAPFKDDQSSTRQILTREKARRMAEFFGVLSDPNRWRILSALAHEELRVRDLAKAVEMSESAVSHQLRVLRNMRLVSYRKRGRNVFYCLKDHHIVNLYRDISEHLDELDPNEDEEHPHQNQGKL